MLAHIPECSGSIWDGNGLPLPLPVILLASCAGVGIKLCLNLYVSKDRQLLALYIGQSWPNG